MRTTRATTSSAPRPSSGLVDDSFAYDGDRSLGTISLYGALLGLVTGISSSAIAFLLLSFDTSISQLWRLPFFIIALAVFHFLEFYITARFNTPAAKVASYLLFSANGWAWNLAHTCAMIEIVLVNTLLVSRDGTNWYNAQYRSNTVIVIGLLFVIGGQAMRTRAMVVASTNFNHIITRSRANTHVLVTHDVYGWFRHPSYLGFFWWAVGTQIVAGNVICCIIYAGVLWTFFRNRIVHEEELLVAFFGKEYQEFRRKTWIGIPFIR